NPDHVMEPHSRFFGRLDRPAQIEVRFNEDAVYAESPRFVGRDGVRNFIGSPSVDSWTARITRLIRRVIGNLGLIEVGPSTVSVPKHLKHLMMLDEQTVNGYLVSVNHEPVVTRVAVPTDTLFVVCPPNPCVIDNYIVAVDAQVDGCAPDPTSANAK